MQHPNAPLTVAGRLKMVLLVEDLGLTFEQAAACSNVSKSTCWTWVDRWRRASPQERATRVCLHDRSSRPRSSPGMLAACEQQRICAARARTGWGPRLIAALVGHPHSTVHATLRRHGCSRRLAPEREAVVRFEWPCPGDLLQMDTKRFARFTRPGHAVTGDRTSSGAQKRERVGYEIAHSIIDDHTRLAYTELHDDERAATVIGFLERALAFFATHGVQPKRLQTDNAWTYTHNRELARLLAHNGIQHRTIPPRTPKRNGKVERYQQTLKREWGLGQRYRSSNHRAQALPHWLHHYNEHRHHSSIGNQPPINRVRNLPRHNS